MAENGKTSGFDFEANGSENDRTSVFKAPLSGK